MEEFFGIGRVVLALLLEYPILWPFYLLGLYFIVVKPLLPPKTTDSISSSWRTIRKNVRSHPRLRIIGLSLMLICLIAVGIKFAHQYYKYSWPIDIEDVLIHEGDFIARPVKGSGTVTKFERFGQPGREAIQIIYVALSSGKEVTLVEEPYVYHGPSPTLFDATQGSAVNFLGQYLESTAIAVVKYKVESMGGEFSSRHAVQVAETNPDEDRWFIENAD